MPSPVPEDLPREPVPKQFICEELHQATGTKCSKVFTRAFNLKRHRMDKHPNPDTSLEARGSDTVGVGDSLSSVSGGVPARYYRSMLKNNPFRLMTIKRSCPECYRSYNKHPAR